MQTIVILSGGMDSAVLLADQLHAGHTVAALSVNYGQRHRRELDYAAKVAAYYDIEHHTADLSALRPLLAGSSQTTDGVPVPHGHYAAESMKQTVVPNRNMLLLALAGAWAISRKADAIAYAAHAGDHTVYPDCRPVFVEALQAALVLADWHPVQIARPFIHWTKAEICRHGDDLDVPFALTYSCYEGGVDHCGLCGTCVERREAFRLAEVPDPTPYVVDAHV